MIYKMTLKDSVDTMTFNLLETPIVDKDIEGAVDNVTLDGNQYTDYLYLKKQYIQKWAIMCPDGYDELRGFYTRQFEEGEVPSYRVYYGANVTRDYTFNGDYFKFNAEGIETGMTLSQLTGNAEQTTYSGKNLFTMNGIETTTYPTGSLTSDVSGDNAVTLTATGTTGAQYYRSTLKAGSFDASKTYTLSGKATKIVKGTDGSSRLTIRWRGSNDNGSTWTSYNDAYSNADPTQGTTYTFSKAITGYSTYQFLFYNNANTPVTIGEKTSYADIMFEQSDSATSYEPYVGGTASPNPDYPQPISTVTGAQNIEAVGKNLFNKDATVVDSSNCTYTYGNGVFTITNTNASNPQITLALDLPVGSYVLNSASYLSRTTQLRDANSAVANLGSSYQNVAFTITSAADSIRFNWLSTTDTITLDLNTLQIEVGSTATAYEPYHGQSYAIDLGSIELAKVGTYQDRIYKNDGKWYIEKQVGKVVLDGAEDGWDITGGGNGYRVATPDIILTPSNELAPIMSDYYTVTTFSRIYNANIDYGISNHNSNHWLAFRNKDITSLANFKTWLGTHNTTVYYALATPTTTEITDETLLYQLNFLASLYKGENNISLVGTGAQGEMEVFIRDVMSVETDVVPEVPVRLTLTDDGVINACGCRRNVQLTMRETTE